MISILAIVLALLIVGLWMTNPSDFFAVAGLVLLCIPFLMLVPLAFREFVQERDYE